MTQNQLKHYRKELLALAASVNEELVHDQRELQRQDELDTPGGPMASTENEPDAGTQEVELGLIANQQHLIAEVTAALERMNRGDFGTCEGCGQAISKARLDAVPYARTCIRCAGVTRPVAG